MTGETRKETTSRSTPYVDDRSPGEQQVKNRVLLRSDLEPENSLPQGTSLPLDHAGLEKVDVQQYYVLHWREYILRRREYESASYRVHLT